MCVHALHTVHALPDLRVAGGRVGGRWVTELHPESSPQNHMSPWASFRGAGHTGLAPFSFCFSSKSPSRKTNFLRLANRPS